MRASNLTREEWDVIEEALGRRVSHWDVFAMINGLLKAQKREPYGSLKGFQNALYRQRYLRQREAA